MAALGGPVVPNSVREWNGVKERKRERERESAILWK